MNYKIQQEQKNMSREIVKQTTRTIGHAAITEFIHADGSRSQHGVSTDTSGELKHNAAMQAEKRARSQRQSSQANRPVKSETSTRVASILKQGLDALDKVR